MDSEHWKQVDRLLRAALERPPEERAEFLRQACAGDEALEREVRSLLASRQDAGSFLERPAIEVAARAIAAKMSDPERKRRFVQEAKAASALNHPNIITIYDIDRADGADFIAMEYVPGKPLDQLIHRKGLRIQDAVQYAIQIADALASAHA